eukprot:6191479-Pleurochrysis_carterae.AAC.2
MEEHMRAHFSRSFPSAASPCSIRIRIGTTAPFALSRTREESKGPNLAVAVVVEVAVLVALALTTEELLILAASAATMSRGVG